MSFSPVYTIGIYSSTFLSLSSVLYLLLSLQYLCCSYSHMTTYHPFLLFAQPSHVFFCTPKPFSMCLCPTYCPGSPSLFSSSSLPSWQPCNRARCCVKSSEPCRALLQMRPLHQLTSNSCICPPCPASSPAPDLAWLPKPAF